LVLKHWKKLYWIVKVDKKLEIDFGLYQINIERVFRFFKQDLKDDWFQDPLLYEDRLKKDTVKEYFRQNIENNCGIFRPTKRQIINIPKKGGTLRYSIETSFFDRIAYHAFGLILIEHFDKLINRRVLSHRLDDFTYRKKKHRYLFLNSIEQWKKFEEYVRVDANEKTILQTDLQNYFENIRIEDLKKTLLKCLKATKAPGTEKAKIRFCIDSICLCLKYWTYNGKNGLPQNRDISSFLANIYMLPIDEHMIGADYDYYRYMDDIRIICNDKYQARNALKELIIQLRKIGLNANGSKTNIIEPDTDDHIAFLKRDSFELERIDAMINSRKKPVVAKAFTEVRNKLEKLQIQNDYRSRTFRFCINRICKIALCKDIVKPSNFFSKITEGITGNIQEVPDATDQFCTYLTAVEADSKLMDDLCGYLTADQKSVYGWQNYLIWKLFAYKQYCKDELFAFARRIIIESSNKANIAGATLYLGKCGSREDRKYIVNNFEIFNDAFTQRHALIAIQEVDFKTIKTNVQQYILEESKGIYKDLRNLKTPKYIEPPKSVKYADLIREVGFYV